MIHGRANPTETWLTVGHFNWAEPLSITGGGAPVCGQASMGR